MIMNTWNEEEVGGVVVGTYYRVGRLYYEGRPQGSNIQGTTDEEIVEKARRHLDTIRQNCGQAYLLVYPNRDRWEVRLFD